MANQVYLSFNEVRKNRDLIFVDQRGTGKSNPLTCGELSEQDLRLPEIEQQNKYLALIRECADKYREHAPFYTTPYAVADLDTVRAALGYQKINLWGGSYGTRVVLEYMRTRPESLRAVILDGVAPVQIALPKYFQSDAWAALTAVNQECVKNAKCTLLYGDTLVQAEVVNKRLHEAQQAGAPIIANYGHPRYQLPTELVLTSKTFSMLVFMSLYSRDLTALLPRAIADAVQGNYRLLAALHALASEQSGFSGISEGIRYSVICNEDNYYIKPEDIAQSRPFLGMDMLADFAKVCAFWPKAELPTDYFSPVKSDLPALLLSGGHDPVTPERWAQQVAQHLSNAQMLLAPGGNHIISMDGCMPQIIAQFIEQGAVKDMKMDCVKSIKSLPLVLGANQKKPTASASSSYSSVSRSSSGSNQQ
jgi:pimeloyl-ACP methyl ester carboxylesterase